MDNENNNIQNEPIDVPASTGDGGQSGETAEIEKEKSIEDQTVERLSNIGDEIDKDELDGVPVTPLDADGDGSEGGLTDGELCVMCGEKPADKSFGENYDLCADCRHKLTRVPLSFASIIILIIVIGLGAFGCKLSANQLPVLKAVSASYNYVKEHRLFSAINSFGSANGLGWKTGRNVVDIYNKTGYLNQISSVIDACFYDEKTAPDGKLIWTDIVGKADLNAPWNKKVKAIKNDYDAFAQASEKYYAFISDYEQQLSYGEIEVKDLPYDEVIKKLEAAKKEEKSSAGLAFISYCEWYWSNICEKSTEIQIKYMKDVRAVRPDYYVLYKSDLTDLLIKEGDYSEAEKLCKELLEINTDDYVAQYYRAVILRRQGKYDEAIALMDGVIAEYETNQFSYAYYEAAINAFFKKDYKNALDYAAMCYDSNYNTANFYALLCKLNDDKDNYDMIIEMLDYYQLEISPTVEKYLKNEITAEEMFNTQNDPFEYAEKAETAETTEREEQ